MRSKAAYLRRLHGTTLRARVQAVTQSLGRVRAELAQTTEKVAAADRALTRLEEDVKSHESLLRPVR